MISCEKRVSANCERKPVTILPMTKPIKTMMNTWPGAGGSSSTRFTMASKPALHAPLKPAATAVTIIIRRHFWKTNLISFIGEPS